MDLGAVERAVSPWASNNVFVPKKDYGVRVTTDYFELNNVTVTESFPMEGVRQTVEWLASK